MARGNYKVRLLCNKFADFPINRNSGNEVIDFLLELVTNPTYDLLFKYTRILNYTGKKKISWNILETLH